MYLKECVFEARGHCTKCLNWHRYKYILSPRILGPVPVFQSQCPRVPGSLPSLKLPIDIETLLKICQHGNFAFHFQIPKYIVNLTDILMCGPLISTMEIPHIIFWSLCHPLNSQPLALVENIKPTFCRR